MNASLINDEIYVKEIKQIINDTGNNYAHLIDKRITWELIKLNIRNFTIPYSIKKARANREYKKKDRRAVHRIA